MFFVVLVGDFVLGNNERVFFFSVTNTNIYVCMTDDMMMTPMLREVT